MRLEGNGGKKTKKNARARQPNLRHFETKEFCKDAIALFLGQNTLCAQKKVDKLFENAYNIIEIGCVWATTLCKRKLFLN